MHKICSHFATSSGFVHLVKQYPSSPHETLHIATNAILIRMEKTTRAAIGYNVRVANNNLRYNLRLPWRKKKKKKRNSSQFITRIASHPRNNHTGCLSFEVELWIASFICVCCWFCAGPLPFWEHTQVTNRRTLSVLRVSVDSLHWRRPHVVRVVNRSEL